MNAAELKEELKKIEAAIAVANVYGTPVADVILKKKEEIEALLASMVDEDEYVFSTMKANAKFMTPEKEQCVRNMVGELLREDDEAKQPCLLLGKVQCGKTDTFENIIGLCFDRGIDVCVVLTKGTNTLAKQTYERMRRDFAPFKDNGELGQKVIVHIFDILDIYQKGLTQHHINNPQNKTIIVCKKEATNMQHLLTLFDKKSSDLLGKRVLIVDDEADFASRAYHRKEGQLELLKISEYLDVFIRMVGYCRVLQVTATPYSLFLQPDGSVQLRDGRWATSWLPRHTELVPVHDKYIGGQQYYIDSKDPDSMYSCLFQPVGEKCLHILGNKNAHYIRKGIHSDNIGGLTRCIVGYLFGAAIRTIQEGRRGRKYRSSCLIHVEIDKKNHKWQEDLIRSIVEDVRRIFLDGNTDMHLVEIENEVMASMQESNRLGRLQGLIAVDMPAKEEVLAEVTRILQNRDFLVSVVNSSQPVAKMLDEGGQLKLEQTVNFFIGGNILDRGITIGNMLGFFYGRDPKKFQMDTVLQHARMYGARSKEDMAVTRFYTSKQIYSVLEKINSVDDMLREHIAKNPNVRKDSFVAYIIGYDKTIKPSSNAKILPANTQVVKPFKRFLPIGFQTLPKTKLKPCTKKIDSMIESLPEYREDGFFLMDYKDAFEIVKAIRDTYVYDEKWDNMEYEWDITEMMTPMNAVTFDSDGKLWCLHRTDRDMSRIRQNGKFSDIPYSGNEDLDPAHEIATDRPVLMLFRENGDVQQGWMGEAFYWPVLVMPANTRTSIFTVNGKKNFKTSLADHIRLDCEATLPKEHLNLTLGREIFFFFLYHKNDKDYLHEHREIRPITASLYLEKDKNGSYILADGVVSGKDYTIHSITDDGRFPYKLKDVRYILFRTSRDGNASKMVVEIDQDCPYIFNSHKITDNDFVYDKYGDATNEADESQREWELVFNIAKVVEWKMTETDEELYQEYVRNVESPEEPDREDNPYSDEFLEGLEHNKAEGKGDVVAKSETVLEAKPMAEPVTEPKAKSEGKGDAEGQGKAEGVSKAEPKPKPEAKPEPASKPKKAPKPRKADDKSSDKTVFVPKGLSVTLYDGRVISEKKAIDTFIKALQEAGLSRIAAAKIQLFWIMQHFLVIFFKSFLVPTVSASSMPQGRQTASHSIGRTISCLVSRCVPVRRLPSQA